MVRQHFKRKELTMNKIFFGIHTSLLLLLCALLACCSQDEEEYASTEKLVPLEFSAVIDGMGTRADATEEKTAFVDGDEITITIDGDDSGTEYKYKYSVDGENKKWVASDSEKQILFRTSTDKYKITAKYGYVDYSTLAGTYMGQSDALINSLVTKAEVSYNSHKVNLEFKHDACKLVINIKGTDKKLICKANVDYYENSTSDKKSSYEEERSYTGYPMTIYIPTSTEYILFSLIFINSGQSVDIDIRNYGATLSNLEAGKTYTCNINYN
jgi:hypothetical protein